MIARRYAFAAFAAALVAPVASALAQAGGLPSSTAPSNSQGTPSGGTGILSTTRVGPASAPPPRRRRRVKHRK